MAFCKKCSPQIKRVLKKIDGVLTGNIEKALVITTLLKRLLDLQVFDSLTYLTKGKFDDQLLHTLRNALAIAVNRLSPQTSTDNLDVFSLLDFITKTLGDSSQDMRDSQLFKIASIIVSVLDGRYSTKDYDLAVQAHYTLSAS